MERNVYSVPSRLIGEWVEVRLYAEQVEVWYAAALSSGLPRLRGRGKHSIDYRHVIDWLVRKPGAFADYRYRDGPVPHAAGSAMAYDALARAAAGAGGQGVPAGSCSWRPGRARRWWTTRCGRLLDEDRPIDGAGRRWTDRRQRDLARPATEVRVERNGSVELYDLLFWHKEVRDGVRRRK